MASAIAAPTRNGIVTAIAVRTLDFIFLALRAAWTNSHKQNVLAHVTFALLFFAGGSRSAKATALFSRL